MLEKHLEQIFWKEGKFLDSKGNELKPEIIDIPSILVWRFEGKKRDSLDKDIIKNYHFDNVLNTLFGQTLFKNGYAKEGNFGFTKSDSQITYWNSKDKTSLESDKDENDIFEYLGRAAVQFYKI